MTDYSTMQMFLRMLRLVKPHIPLLVSGMVFDILRHLGTICIGLLGVLLIFAVKEGGEPSSLVPIGIAIIVIALLRGVCGYFAPYLNHIAAFHILTTLRDMFYAKMDPLAPAIFITRRTGDLVSVAINNIELFELFFAHTMNQVAVSIIVPFIVIVALAWIHPYLAGIMLIIFILAALIPTLTIWANRQKGERLRAYLATLGSFLIDSVQGIWEILAFGRGKDRVDAMVKMILNYRKEQQAYVRVNALTSASYAIIASAGIVIVLVEATILSQQGEINSFYLPIAVILASGAFGPIREIIEVSKQLSMTIAGAKRFFTIMDDLPVVDENDAKDIKISKTPNIEVSDLWFKYGENEPDILKGVNFSIPSGCTVAIVGMTGAGKTTITHLLMRFWDPQRGTIKIDDHNIKDISLNELRQTISIVAQDIFLFNDSIMENIRIGRIDASDEEVIQAARFARIHNFISGLPDRYDTLVGERGIRLSGGERQRVAIARAILKRSPILIMDEATSSLDTETELMIRETIHELMKDHTVFIIAHRLSTVVNADKILVLKSGEIIEEGNHQELMNKRGMYASLIEAQNF